MSELRENVTFMVGGVQCDQILFGSDAEGHVAIQLLAGKETVAFIALDAAGAEASAAELIKRAGMARRAAQ
jgi:hypothetical protein